MVLYCQNNLYEWERGWDRKRGGRGREKGRGGGEGERGGRINGIHEIEGLMLSCLTGKNSIYWRCCLLPQEMKGLLMHVLLSPKNLPVSF